VPPLEPVGTYGCNVNLPIVIEATLGNEQLGTIILVDPPTQSTTGSLKSDLGLASPLLNQVLDLRASVLKGNSPSTTAILTVDVYQTPVGDPSTKLHLRSFGDSKEFNDDGVARLLVSVMLV
jgi:hypothetical protein